MKEEEEVPRIKLAVALITAIVLAVSLVSAQEVSQEDYDAAIDELRFILTDTAMHIDASYFGAVSYTHLTLPTILLV